MERYLKEILIVDNKSNPVLKKYSPNLVYFHFGDSINSESGEFFVSDTLLKAIVTSKKPIILTEDDFSVIIYKLDFVERDLTELMHKNLTIKTKPILRSIPDTGFIYVAGSKVRPKTGFLEVTSEDNTVLYTASVMKKAVKRIW